MRAVTNQIVLRDETGFGLDLFVANSGAQVSALRAEASPVRGTQTYCGHRGGALRYKNLPS